MTDNWNDYPNKTPDPNHPGHNPQGYVVEIVPEVKCDGPASVRRIVGQLQRDGDGFGIACRVENKAIRRGKTTLLMRTDDDKNSLQAHSATWPIPGDLS